MEKGLLKDILLSSEGGTLKSVFIVCKWLYTRITGSVSQNGNEIYFQAI